MLHKACYCVEHDLTPAKRKKKKTAYFWPITVASFIGLSLVKLGLQHTLSEAYSGDFAKGLDIEL